MVLPYKRLLLAGALLGACPSAFAQSSAQRLTASIDEVNRQEEASARLHDGLNRTWASLTSQRPNADGFWDGNTRKGDVAEPVAAYSHSPLSAPSVPAPVGVSRTDVLPGSPALTQNEVASAACRAALEGYATASSLCGNHPTLAPIVAGVLDAFRQQFGTVQGILTNLAWMLISLVMTVISGFGMIAKVAMGLISFGLTAGMLWPLIKQGYEAVRDFRRARANSEEYFSSLFRMGLVGGTTLILALLAAAGYGVAKSHAGQAAFASMDHVLSTKVGEMGLSMAAADESSWSPGSVASLLTNIVTPEAKAGRVAAALSRGASQAAEFGGNRNLSQSRDSR